MILFAMSANINRQEEQRLALIELILDRVLSPPKLKKAIINNISLYYKYSDDKNTNQQYNTTQDNLYNNCIKIKQILDGVTSSAVASSSLPIVANYCKTNKVGRRYSARNWIKILITNLLSIHNNA